MANITPENAENGLQGVTMAAASGGGDTVTATGYRTGGWDLGVLLIARNGHTATQTVTVDGTGYVVPANGGIAVVPIRGGTVSGTKAVTYSGVTALTVGAVRVASST